MISKTVTEWWYWPRRRSSADVDFGEGLAMGRTKGKRRPSWLKEWRELSSRMREEHPQCAVCGSTERLQVHHILDKRLYPAYRLDPSNLIVLCPSCHTFGRHSAHGNGLWFAEWLRSNRPGQYEWPRRGCEGEGHNCKNRVRMPNHRLAVIHVFCRAARTHANRELSKIV